MIAFTKSGPSWEPKLQRFLAGELPDVTPPISEVFSDENGRAAFLMPDLSAEGYQSVQSLVMAGDPRSLTAFLRAMEVLAVVHERFRGEVDDLVASGVPVLDRGSDLSRLAADLRSIARDIPVSELAGRLASALTGGPPKSWEEATGTLLHGDIQPSNIMVAPDGSVRIVDWGESRIGPAAWDLGLQPKPMVDAYIHARSSRIQLDGQEDFLAQVRWAGTVKAAEGIRFLISSDLFGETGDSALAALSVAVNMAV